MCAILVIIVCAILVILFTHSAHKRESEFPLTPGQTSLCHRPGKMLV